MARGCRVEERDEYEAFLEAAIVFGRSALHRLQPLYEKHPDWKTWWNGLRGDKSVEFFRTQRDYLLKEGPTKVGQVIRVGTPTTRAEEHYYFETSDVPATETIERHLQRITKVVADAHARFGATKSKTI
jgi:hypothetical protein